MLYGKYAGTEITVEGKDLLIMREYGDYSYARDFKQYTVHELRAYGFELALAFEDDPRNQMMFEREGIPCVYIHSGYH